jgi:hypothetical protein
LQQLLPSTVDLLGGPGADYIGGSQSVRPTEPPSRRPEENKKKLDM